MSDRTIMGTVVILVACFATRGAVRHLQFLWLPEAAATILVGMLAGLLIKVSDADKIHFSEDLFMRVFLPPILLEATLAIDKRSFRKLIGPILMFALVGMFVASASFPVQKFGLDDFSVLTSTCQRYCARQGV